MVARWRRSISDTGARLSAVHRIRRWHPSETIAFLHAADGLSLAAMTTLSEMLVADRRRGAGSVSTFVLIHAAGDSGWAWHPVAAVLRGHGHDVVAPDLPADDESA